MENEETPKISKTEEKESFLKRLEQETSELKRVKDEIHALVERNEELAARNLLGGRSDAGIQPADVKDETPAEYAHRIEKGLLKPGEFK